MSSSSSSSLDSLDDFPTAFDAATCVRRGLCPVTKLRPQGPQLFESHSLYYEQHGSGKHKIVFIMGLNSSSFSWSPQVHHFGASGFKREREKAHLPDVGGDDVDRNGGYTILVFDNRGVGNSSTPRGPYT
jgi:pimeloyl-ACP methyl ester carboxylesterase